MKCLKEILEEGDKVIRVLEKFQICAINKWTSAKTNEHHVYSVQNENSDHIFWELRSGCHKCKINGIH